MAKYDKPDERDPRGGWRGVQRRHDAAGGRHRDAVLEQVEAREALADAHIDQGAAVAACQAVRAAHDPHGAVLDAHALEQAEAALEQAISEPVAGHLGVRGRTPDGRLLAYPDARAAWMRLAASQG